MYTHADRSRCKSSVQTTKVLWMWAPGFVLTQYKWTAMKIGLRFNFWISYFISLFSDSRKAGMFQSHLLFSGSQSLRIKIRKKESHLFHSCESGLNWFGLRWKYLGYILSGDYELGYRSNWCMGLVVLCPSCRAQTCYRTWDCRELGISAGRECFGSGTAAVCIPRGRWTITDSGEKWTGCTRAEAVHFTALSCWAAMRSSTQSWPWGHEGRQPKCCPALSVEVGGSSLWRHWWDEWVFLIASLPADGELWDIFHPSCCCLWPSVLLSAAVVPWGLRKVPLGNTVRELLFLIATGWPFIDSSAG